MTFSSYELGKRAVDLAMQAIEKGKNQDALALMEIAYSMFDAAVLHSDASQSHQPPLDDQPQLL
jgi:hypothetical protein